MSTLSSADSKTSWKFNIRRSEGDEEGRTGLRRTDSMKQLNKTMAKTWRGYQRVTNFGYEREWRRERRQAFDPVPMKVALGDVEGPQCACPGFPCKHL